MGDILYWLLNMSIIGSVAGLFVLLLRLIKALPRRFINLLWAIPLLRFCIPVGLGGRYGLMSLLPRYVVKTVPVSDGAAPFFGISAMNSLQAASGYFPITYKIDLLADVFRYASIVWAVIAAALLIAMTVIYISTLSELKGAERLHGNVYCSDKITSPAVYGVFRPKIIIPVSYKDSPDLDLILLHERQHIKRLDNFYRIAAFVVAAVHWFNPLAWLFLKLYLSDSELACDESVLSKLNEDERKQYAYALLDAHKSKTVFASAFGGAKLKTRIERIVSFKKMTVVSVVGLGVLAAVIAYILLTNAV